MAEPNEPLTERELQIVQSLATGASNKEIAAQWFLSPNTVKVHLRNIFTKLDVQTRTEATMIAVRNGWVAVGDAIGDGANLPLAETGHNPEVSRVPSTATDVDIASTPVDRGEATDSVTGIVSEVAESESNGKLFETLPEMNSILRTVITPVPVAPNPQLLPPLSLRRRLAVVGALVIAVALSVLSLQVRPSDATSNPDDVAATEVLGSPALTTSQSTRWNTRASVRSARARSIAVGVPAQNSIVLIGGQIDRRISGEVLVYNRGEDSWRELNADKPTPVINTGAALINSHIYIPGGTTTGNVATDHFEALDLKTNTWTALPRLPQPSTGHAVASVDNQIFVLGGRVGSQVSGESRMFDATTNRWSVLPPMPSPRENAAAAAFNDRVYVVGGFDGRHELATCEFYSITNQTWSKCAPMTVGRSSFGLVMVGPALFAIGGGTVNFIGWNEKYDPATNKWTTFETPATHAGDWRQIAVAAFPAELYVIGGRTRNVPLSDMYVYEVLSNRTFLPAFQSAGN